MHYPIFMACTGAAVIFLTSHPYTVWTQVSYQAVSPTNGLQGCTAAGTNVSGATVCRVLQKNGLTIAEKNLSKSALSTRVNSWQKFSNILLNVLHVFLDKTGSDHWLFTDQRATSLPLLPWIWHQNFGNCCSLHWRPCLLWTDHWDNQWWQAVCRGGGSSQKVERPN